MMAAALVSVESAAVFITGNSRLIGTVLRDDYDSYSVTCASLPLDAVTHLPRGSVSSFADRFGVMLNATVQRAGHYE